MNLRKAKKKLFNDTNVRLWINSFRENRLAMLKHTQFKRFAALCGNKDMSDMYNSSIVILYHFMNFDCEQGYVFAKRYNISKKQYLKIIRGKNFIKYERSK